MKLIVSKKNFSPFFNLVVEEVILKDQKNHEDIIFLYRHDNAVIIGRNQNAHEEVKRKLIEQNNVELYRRISGGGAVYHDLGNIVFSFITNKSDGNYEKFLTPIIEFLQSLNLDAQFKGRNDLVVNGYKVSGNAQFIYQDRMVHHGTILYNSDLTKIGNYLTPHKLKMESKGIKSARQRITNIYNEIENKISTEEFLEKLIDFLINKYNCQYIELDDMLEKYQNEIKQCKNERISEEWIYGKNPIFSFKNSKKFDKGILEVWMQIENDLIKDINFTGDFLSKKDPQEIINKFINIKYKKEEIEKILNQIDLDEYFGGIEKEEIIHLMIG